MHLAALTSMGKRLTAVPDRVLPLGQPWDRVRAQVCDAAESSSLALDTTVSAWPRSVRLHSVKWSYFLLHQSVKVTAVSSRSFLPSFRYPYFLKVITFSLCGACWVSFKEILFTSWFLPSYIYMYMCLSKWEGIHFHEVSLGRVQTDRCRCVH